MPITFPKAAVIQAAKNAIANQASEAERYAADVEKARTDHAAAWVDGPGRERVRELRDILTAELKRGGVIEADTVKSKLKIEARYDYSLSYVFYSAPSSRDLGKVQLPRVRNVPVAEYRAAIAVLEAVDEDRVTTNALKTMGFTNLRALFEAASALVQSAPAGENADV